MTYNITSTINTIVNSTKSKVFICWVPSHQDIKGNELADSLAKLGLYRKKNKQAFTSISFLKRAIQEQTNRELHLDWNSQKTIPRNYSKTRSHNTTLCAFSERCPRSKFIENTSFSIISNSFLHPQGVQRRRWRDTGSNTSSFSFDRR